MRTEADPWKTDAGQGTPGTPLGDRVKPAAVSPGNPYEERRNAYTPAPKLHANPTRKPSTEPLHVDPLAKTNKN